LPGGSDDLGGSWLAWLGRAIDPGVALASPPTIGAASCSTGVKLQPDTATKTPSPNKTLLKRAVGRNPLMQRRLRDSLSEKRGEERRTMWLIYLEAGIALILVLMIVYWTMRGKK
jgi:hypothetical protein